MQYAPREAEKREVKASLLYDPLHNKTAVHWEHKCSQVRSEGRDVRSCI